MKESRIKVGFLGSGYIADWHARALKGVPGAALEAVCDVNEARARRLAARHQGARAYTNLDAMLAQEQLDVVHVLLPAELHTRAAETILSSNVGVLLEKPMCISPEQCQVLVDLASARGTKLGVSHNFLFSRAYEELRKDLTAHRFGPVEEILITWNKELGQLQAGPFDLWMIREPRNLVLEIGPHLVSAMLDLCGACEIHRVETDDPVTLGDGRQFPRHLRVEARAGRTRIALRISLAPGFTEHRIQLRGRLASATVDFERDLYIPHEHTPRDLDFDRYAMITRESRLMRSQARGTILRSVAAKLRGRATGPYDESLEGAIRAFYNRQSGEIDKRISGVLGRDTVAVCAEIGRHLLDFAPANSTLSSQVNGTKGRPSGESDVLILGATGFIGRALARQLVEKGRKVRVLVRNPSRLPAESWVQDVEIRKGDLSDPTALADALTGVRFVQHLARPHVNTWEEFLEHEVEATRKVALACLEAKIERLIYTSTIDCYYAGVNAGIITEQTPLDPNIRSRNYYARAKAMSESILGELWRDRRLPVVVLRPGVVVGRGTSPLHWGVGKWSYDAICQLWGEGVTPIPFVLVEDVAEALIQAMDKPGIEGESFNLVAQSEVTAKEYVHELGRAAGVRFQTFSTPIWHYYLADLVKYAVKRAIRHPDKRVPSYRDWETRTQRAQYDCSKARRILGWKPSDRKTALICEGIEIPAAEYFK